MSKNTIFAIDPGPEESAFIEWRHKEQIINNKGIVANTILLNSLEKLNTTKNQVVIEMVQSFGMPVGESIFRTVLWIGQFLHACMGTATLVYRQDIKLHHCHSMKAKDSNIRQALIDRFGPPGIKKKPGILYGISKDIWSAFAIAIFYGDTHKSII